MKIGEYELDGELRTDNSGFSKWGYAMRDGKAYFIKEFLSPVYPANAGVLEPTLMERKKKICTDYEERTRKIYKDIDNCIDGNIVRISEFFRYGSKYYVTTERIAGIPWDMVPKLSAENKIQLCQVLLHSVGTLHSQGIVHGDIKVDNIVFKKLQSGYVTAKLIDFDTCFYESSPPSPTEEIHGDMVYMAPETVKMMVLEEGTITSAIDVFALGIVFHQIFTGELPDYDRTQFHYPCEVLLNDGTLKIESDMPAGFKGIIADMLEVDPDRRITVAQVMEKIGMQKIEDAAAGSQTGKSATEGGGDPTGKGTASNSAGKEASTGGAASNPDSNKKNSRLIIKMGNSSSAHPKTDRKADAEERTYSQSAYSSEDKHLREAGDLL